MSVNGDNVTCNNLPETNQLALDKIHSLSFAWGSGFTFTEYVTTYFSAIFCGKLKFMDISTVFDFAKVCTVTGFNFYLLEGLQLHL